ncbi:phosphotransferase [Streptomyces inhibens]|uniref:phosphotransferase n=1 Tax=Streptomyces inhibens TaxID=2293571 RepID=UPI0037989244
MSERWWKSLRTVLETIAATPTERVAVRRRWIDRALPQHAGVPAPSDIDWATAHGDCHFANLTTAGPTLLDFEGFGLAPVAYDPALLYAYSLLAPRAAARIHAEFPILNTPAGHTALLVVAADLLQSASRGDHPELIDRCGASSRRLRSSPARHGVGAGGGLSSYPKDSSPSSRRLVSTSLGTTGRCRALPFRRTWCPNPYGGRGTCPSCRSRVRLDRWS